MSNDRARAREHLDEGTRLEKAGLFERALEAYREARRGATDPDLLAEAWRLEAYAHHARSAWTEALDAARRSRRIATDLGRSDMMAEALNAEAAVHFSRGDLDAAMPLYEEMLAMSGDPRIRGLAHQNLGIIHARRDELDRAELRLAQAFDEFDGAEYEWGKAHVLNNRVGLALERKDPAEAARLSADAVSIARAVGDLELLAVATLNRAEALAALGRLDEAEQEASTALGHIEVSGNRWRRVACLRILGDLNAEQGDAVIAERFWTRALAVARELGAMLEVEQLERRLGPGDPKTKEEGP